ncbi:MAG: NirD/YgiW/YdeI family stress tolerance protein [Alphaproteobacteria bacterium]|nr:NirD/YgiW/YdeI family stress tolerance protein [Alphaproteobacteria bacterium]
MKKLSISLLATAACICFTCIANAQNMTQQAPQPQKATVAEAQNMPDESIVILEGTITSNLGDETYIFTDSTGNINVEIDDEEWNGISPSAQDIIMIQGEVDKDGNLVEIDVEEVMLPE